LIACSLGLDQDDFCFEHEYDRVSAICDGVSVVWFGLFVSPSGDLKFKKGVDANGRVPKVSCEGRLFRCMHWKSCF
jgi:hypothetical protein